jgi:hypothetical protein
VKGASDPVREGGTGREAQYMALLPRSGPLAGLESRAERDGTHHDSVALLERFAPDPWIESGMIVITAIRPWTVLLEGRLSVPS